jgi:hypothetical protein
LNASEVGRTAGNEKANFARGEIREGTISYARPRWQVDDGAGKLCRQTKRYYYSWSSFGLCLAMEAPKGHPRYGGRVAGTPNKATLMRATHRIDEALSLSLDQPARCVCQFRVHMRMLFEPHLLGAIGAS